MESVGSTSTSASPSGSHSPSSDTRPPPPSSASAAAAAARNRKRDREPPRTKGTCDRCALSKVKCDRQQPYCARCVAIGRDLGIEPPCHYTVSLRSLKRKNAPNPPKRERSGTESTLSSNSTAAPPTPELKPLDGMITPSPFPDQEGAVVDLGSEGGSDYAASPPQVEPSAPRFRIPFQRSKSDTLYPFGPSSFNGSTSSSPTTPSVGYPNPLERSSSRCTTAALNRFGTDNLRRDCLDLIHSCTHDMVRTRTSNSRPSIGLDQVLSINGRTISAFNAIMECPCTEATDSAFSLACLLHTTFLFFRNAVDSLLPIESLRAGPPYYTIDILPRLHVLRSELEKISIVADEFFSRFCQQGENGNNNMQFQMLKYSLNMELKQCLDALDERAGCRS